MSRTSLSQAVIVCMVAGLALASCECLRAQDSTPPPPASSPAETPVVVQPVDNEPVDNEPVPPSAAQDAATITPTQVPVAEDPVPPNMVEIGGLVVENAASAAVSARIRQALNRSVDVEFLEVPLRDVAAYLQEYCQIPIFIDTLALDEVGMGSDTPVTITMKGISLRSLLDIMLGERELTYTIRDEMLKITTPEQADEELEIRVYQVTDLAVEAPPSLIVLEPYGRYDALLKLIADSLAPESWEQVGGAGTAWVYEPWGILVVSQSQELHEQLALLLAALRTSRSIAVGNGSTPVDSRPVATIPVAVAQAQERIEQALNSQITFAFEETPLSEVAAFIAEDRGIPVWIDNKALDDIGMGCDTPVSLSVQDVTLRSALQLLGRKSQLDFAVQHEVLVMSTTEELGRGCVTKVYSVADFVEALDRHSGSMQVVQALKSLQELIETTIDPDTWENVGGEGSVSVVPEWRLLVISQREKVHAQVESVLQTARQVRKPTAAAAAEGGTIEPVGTMTPPSPAAVLAPGDASVVAQALVIPGPGSPVPATSAPPVLLSAMVLKVYVIPDFESDQLAKAIRGTVTPGSWTNDVNGPAIFTVGTNLLIRQTESGHAEIQQLIQGLRPRKGGMIPR